MTAIFVSAIHPETPTLPDERPTPMPPRAPHVTPPIGSRFPSRRAALMAGLFAAALTVAGALVLAQDPSTNTAIKPEPRDGSWVKMHEAFLERTKKGNIDLLFLGDSITAGWGNRSSQGPATVWERYYGPRHVANFGIGGDRTQHVLWRLERGEVDGITPKVVVLMIGTNNTGSNTPAEIAEGITAIVKSLRAKLPATKVLLLGVFPRGPKDNPARARIQAINAQVAKLDDGKTVKYLDIGARFLETDGTLSREIMPDLLHLSTRGYRIWADAIEPTLWEMMGAK
jgi:lysophospholipase L1-like esterase